MNDKPNTLPTLDQALQSSTWRRLLAIMERHSLSASTRQSKKPYFSDSFCSL
ncbi:MAG: hypothetical protein AAF702_19455 [Chloroflexota bacterium]